MIMNFFLVHSFIFAFLIHEALCLTPLIEKFAWKKMDFAYPDDQSRQQAISSGAFIPENILPTGFAVHNDRMFITVPRWEKGVPSSLNYVSLSENSTSPKMNPYPNWVVNKEGNCEGITTPSKVRIDKCDRLWVFDSGNLELDEGLVPLCPYAIHVYDLKTDTKIRKYNLKSSDIKPLTTIASIALDEGDSCDDIFIYASDITEHGLIVYNFKDNDSWRFEHSYFMPDPLAEDYNIGGLNVQWHREGLFGLALTPIRNNGTRTLYFHPLSSCSRFYVSTEVLRNKLRVNDSYHDFHVLTARGPYCHLTTHVIDDKGVMFFNIVDDNAIGCWNTKKTYQKENLEIVAKDQTLVFPTDLYLDRNHMLWVMSNPMSLFLEGKLNFEEINFRVYYNSVQNFLSNSICAP